MEKIPESTWLYNYDVADDKLVQHIKSKLCLRFEINDLLELPVDDRGHIIIALFKSAVIPECLLGFERLIPIHITCETIQADKLNYSKNSPFLKRIIYARDDIIEWVNLVNRDNLNSDTAFISLARDCLLRKRKIIVY